MDYVSSFSLFHHIFLWLCVFLCYKIYQYTKQRKYRLPPGPKGLPLVGILPFLSDKPYLNFMEWGKKYGGIFSVYLGRSYAVVVTDADIGIELLGKTTTTDRPPDMFLSVPDGAGKRICPGKLVALIQLFYYFVSIMQKFQVLPATETSLPDLEGVLGLSLIPKPQKLRFLPR